MASSREDIIEGLGPVRIQKKRGLKRITMRLHNSGQVRVSIPAYLPFSSGTYFAKTHIEWIKKQQQKQPNVVLENGMPIGKTRRLHIIQSEKTRTRIVHNGVLIYTPELVVAMSDSQLITTTKKAIKRALLKEAAEILPVRVSDLAKKHDYTYSTIKTKPLKSRWGSCSHKKELTFNCYLLMMPWEVIDYVIMHELSHTKQMHHGIAFWAEVAKTTPNYKALKAKLKQLQPEVHAFYV